MLCTYCASPAAPLGDFCTESPAAPLGGFCTESLFGKDFDVPAYLALEYRLGEAREGGPDVL
jgi:hypothetical protein